MMKEDHKFVQISLPSDFKDVFQTTTEDSFGEQIRISLALAAFVEKRVTLARAAELAEKSLSEFIDLLSNYQIPWMEYTEEIFKEDQATLEKLKDDSKENE